MGRHPHVRGTAELDRDHMIQQSFQAALQAHQAGRLAEAAALYQTVLKVQPNHADCLHLSGLILHQQGQSAEGERLIRRAIAAMPKQAHFHLNLGEVCRALEKWDAAIRAYEKALKLDPTNVDGWVGQAEALFAAGRLDAAIAAYRQALKHAPGDSSVWNNLGNALAAAKRFDASVDAYQQVLQLRPGSRDAIYNLVMLLAELGRVGKAVEQLRSWLSAHSADSELIRLLARLQARNWDRQGALETLASLPKELQKQPGVVLERGLLLEELGEIDHALVLYNAAIEHCQGTERSALLARIGVCHEQQGDAAATEQAYRQALQADSHCIVAWEGLQAVGAITEPEAAEIARQIDGGALGGESSARLAFVLGARLEKSGEYPRAFEYYQRANRGIAKLRYFDADQFATYTDQIIETFSAGYFRQLGAETEGPQLHSAPIFIVGMPRSGTTLVERMLARHPKVRAGGERDEVRRLIAEAELLSGEKYPVAAAALNSQQREQLVSAYRIWTASLAPADGYFTDKLPSNYLRLGLIATLFPGARIIHCCRDPRDTCLSCYTTHFNQGQSFSYDLRHLGQAYAEYRRLMAHWNDVLPVAPFELNYAELVTEPERVGRALMAYCGLEGTAQWESFQDGGAPVRTASVWQVRQPLYTSSLNRWQRFGGSLQPLLDELKPFIEESGSNA